MSIHRKYSILGSHDVVETTLDLLLLVTLDLDLRARLDAEGYTDDEHARGYELVHNVHTCAVEGRCHENPGVTRAERHIESWTPYALRTFDAVLAKTFPAQRAFMLAGLRPAYGIAAIAVAKTLLRRWVELGRRSRSKTAESLGDQAALAALERNGMDDNVYWQINAGIERLELAARPRSGKPIDTSLERAPLTAWFDRWAGVLAKELCGPDPSEEPRDGPPSGVLGPTSSNDVERMAS